MQLKRTLVWLLICTTVVVGYAFERDIRAYFSGRDRFDLSRLAFTDTLGNTARLEKGYRGYVVFYSDYSGCGVCLSKLMELQGFSVIYEDIAIVSILNEKNDWRQFREQLLEYGIPGEVLHDPHANLGKKLALSPHPQLLFFDRHQNLVAMVPMTVRHEQLWKQIHIYAGEL
ncbi:TlpA family protein disulfide reductase [Acanthopleuribacter pedis]|uniref:Uncharacterized protein n=1 Tax=Acanthopleuribacter pedis TaxID=442870 RepID=A0A8J7U1X8_9BACT|nr:hypothetical protein [Acanthopleuribacter pedis]MBO1317371.1 hypothetical protein [Acanthopleuribacter pedis]MBO1318678.1 hypothetical protein [Acanthopleuribacter pedis]